MSAGGAQFAISAASAVNSISAGYAKKAEDNYNATLLDNKAALSQAQQEIQQGQDTKKASQYLSKSLAIVAKNGLQPSGSAMAVITATQTQLNIDKAINSFNIQQDINYSHAAADQQRRAGSSAVRSGYTSAFSALLNGSAKYLSTNGKTTSGFDYSTIIPTMAGGS